MDDIYKDVSAVASEHREGMLAFGFESMIGVTITPAIREGHQDSVYLLRLALE